MLHSTMPQYTYKVILTFTSISHCLNSLAISRSNSRMLSLLGSFACLKKPTVTISRARAAARVLMNVNLSDLHPIPKIKAYTAPRRNDKLATTFCSLDNFKRHICRLFRASHSSLPSDRIVTYEWKGYCNDNNICNKSSDRECHQYLKEELALCHFRNRFPDEDDHDLTTEKSGGKEC